MTMQTNLRIAFVNPDLWVGGGTVFLLNLAGEFVRRGIPTQVFSMNNVNSLASDFEQQHIPVALDARPAAIMEDRISRTLHQLRKFSPTVVIANAMTASCEVLRYLPAGVARVGIIHLNNQCVFELTKLYSDSLDHIVAVSTAAESGQRKAFSGFQSQVPQISCIELGVPIPNEPRASFPESGSPIRILYLGRLEEDAKRVRLFPEICRILEASGIPFQWTIAGDGPERSSLESQMRPQRADQQVRFTGIVPYSKVTALLRENDIVLLTSSTESFPLSLHEGMAWGLVPVVTDLPGRVRELVTPGIGILVNPADVAGYAEAIIALQKDPKRVRSMSAAARAAISAKYSVSAMADRWLETLGKIELRPLPQWPATFDVQAPRGCNANSWRFTKPGRAMRRCAKVLSQINLRIEAKKSMDSKTPLNKSQT